MKLRELRNHHDGRLPAYGWPGGYQIIYIMQDGEVMCPDCANGENGSLASETSDDPQWRLVGFDIFFEGPSEFCCHCNTEIESAYGDPDSDSEEEAS